MQHFIAIDLGTTHTKAVIVNENGKVLHTGKAIVTSFQQQEGEHTQDAEAIFQNVLALLKECIGYLKEDNKGNIWLGSRINEGVFRYDGKSVTNLKLMDLFQVF